MKKTTPIIIVGIILFSICVCLATAENFNNKVFNTKSEGVKLAGGDILPSIDGSYSKGDENLNLTYQLITNKDMICGRAYTPECVFNKNTVEKNMKIEYMKEYQESVADYSIVCNSYNKTRCNEYEEKENITCSEWDYPYFENCTEVISSSHMENKCGWFQLKDSRISDKETDKDSFDYFDINSGGCHLVWKQSISGKDAKLKSSVNTDNLKLKLSFVSDNKVDVVPSLTITDKSKDTAFEMKEMAWWNNAWTYKRLVYYNTTQTALNKPVIYAINGTRGINSSICWASPNDRFIGNTNYTEYLYYQDFNNFSLVNQTEDTQRPLDCENSTGVDYQSRKVYDSNYVTAVYHLNGTGNSILGNNIVWNNTPDFNQDGIFSGKSPNFNGSGGTTGGIGATILPSAGITDPQANNLSYLFWIKFNSAAYVQVFMDKDVVAGTNFIIMQYRNDVKALRLTVAGNGGELTVDKLGDIVPGEWYMVVATLDGTNMNLYVNDTAKASTAQTRSAVGTNAIILGQYYNGNLRLNGVIDEFRVYNKSLTAEEVKDLYQQGRTLYGRSLLGAEEELVLPSPFIQNITITPNPSLTTEALNCSANYGGSSNAGTINLTWYNGSVVYSSQQWAAIAEGAMISNQTKAGIQAAGETWNCTINATNVDGSSVPNSTVTMGIYCQFQGRVKDSDGTTDVNLADVVIINQTDNKRAWNVTSNTTGGWATNISSSGYFSVYSYNPADTTKDADADPFIWCT